MLRVPIDFAVYWVCRVGIFCLFGGSGGLGMYGHGIVLGAHRVI